MDPTARRTAMSRQGSSKQAHEFGCLKTAQESLAGFPEGEINSGGDPPDCYVAVPNCGDVAFELTEQVDRVAVRPAALAKRFIEKARAEFFAESFARSTARGGGCRCLPATSSKKSRRNPTTHVRGSKGGMA